LPHGRSRRLNLFVVVLPASVCEAERYRLPALVPAAFAIIEEFRADILNSLRRVKIGRAAGPDGVYGEMIRVAEP
jgi:hypothetical protein